MSAPIGPGDWVECLIDADFGFRRGKLYCVVDVGPLTLCNACGKLEHRGLNFAEPATRPGQWWAGCRFRPIYRRDESLTQRLMEPVSDRIEPGVSRKSRQDQPAHDEPVSSLREVA